MMGLENMGDIPFRHVYLHGLIRDENRVKMSKSRGNVIDPVRSIEQYGTDALRFALSTGNSPGNDMLLGSAKLEGSRNFTNKLWNAARFVIGNMNAGETEAPPAVLPAEDRWILSRLNRLVADMDDLMGSFQFGEALRRIYEFLWTEYCDWYIEISKPRLRDTRDSASPLPVLVGVLETALRLLHPFMPFITEELWQRIREHHPEGKPDSIMIAPFPTADTSAFDDGAEREMEAVIDIVRSIRNARAESKVAPAKYIEAVIVAGDSRDSLEAHASTIGALARVRPLTFVDGKESKDATRDRAKTLVLTGVEVILPLEGMIDVAAEKSRIEQEIESTRSEVARIEALLANESFVGKAPAAVVEKERQKVADRRDTLSRLEEKLADLG